MLNRWQRTIVDIRGNIMPSAVLMIRRESDQALVTVYKDRLGTDPYPMGQVTADANGYVYFYAPADLYRLVSAEPVIDWRDVDIGAAAARSIATQALENSLPTYETKSEMVSDAGQDTPTLGRVVNDSTPANNGYYVWDGVSWEWAEFQPANDYAVQQLANALSSHQQAKDNPHEVTADQVGLDQVDNTSDADKPISTAAQNALDDKFDKSDVVSQTGSSTDKVMSQKAVTVALDNISPQESVLMHKNIITKSITIPDGYNALMISPVQILDDVIIEGAGNSTLRGI